MRRLLLVPLSFLLMVGLALPAGADVVRQRDGDDTPGRLDIRRVVHGHTENGRLKHRVVTFKPWKARHLRRRANYIYVWFSTDGEKRFAERRVVIDFVDGKLQACIQMYDEINDGAAVGPCEDITLRRPDTRTALVVFRRRMLRRNLQEYSWSASTSFKSPESKRCSEEACLGVAPPGRGRGRVVHEL